MITYAQNKAAIIIRLWLCVAILKADKREANILLGITPQAQHKFCPLSLVSKPAMKILVRTPLLP
jgi:hypothetical protein